VTLPLYIARRLAWTVPTLLLVGLLVFVLMRLVPGDPALLILGDSATQEQLAAMRAEYGLDKPLPLQFAYWLGEVAQGDLGKSITSGEDVLPLLFQRFQVSAAIVLVAVALAVLLAVPAGLYAAWKQNSIVDTMVVAAATFFLSIPSFWLGLLLLLFVGLKLGLVPVVGYVPFSEDWRAAITFLILPTIH
jgi:peptide/nickel transport system permease protein